VVEDEDENEEEFPTRPLEPVILLILIVMLLLTTGFEDEDEDDDEKENFLKAVCPGTKAGAGLVWSFAGGLSIIAARHTAMKHNPFQSIYREQFEVVEQRLGNVTLYPHTDQLPLLHRALNLEFLGPLPGYIARVDKRADGFHKILRRNATMMYCSVLNGARADELRLYSLPDADRVARLTIVQQVTESTPLGRVHRFRFYGPDGFFPEIRLSGKRIAFADHVLQRFSQRVPNPLGTDITNLLSSFYGNNLIGLPVGPGRAFVMRHMDSILAFTYKESADEYFLTTCLTVNEMSSLREERPVRAYNFHYGEAFTEPADRSEPVKNMAAYIEIWRQRTPLEAVTSLRPEAKKDLRREWSRLAQNIREIALVEGHGPGSDIQFLDYIPGPRLMEAFPPEPCPEGEKLRARIVAQHPTMKAVIDQHKTDLHDSLIQ
jgi:hypothetical protein